MNEKSDLFLESKTYFSTMIEGLLETSVISLEIENYSLKVSATSWVRANNPFAYTLLS